MFVILCDKRVCGDSWVLGIGFVLRNWVVATKTRRREGLKSTRVQVGNGAKWAGLAFQRTEKVTTKEHE